MVKTKKLFEPFKKWLTKSLGEGSGRRSYYRIYSISFLLIALLCFSYFYLSNRSLIWIYDGWSQHFKALVYYSQYLRSIIANLIINHKIVIPDWDFCLGEGGDIVNTLHYYVIGDPIAFLSVLVPTKYLQWFYSASCVFRLYLSGIVFSELCFGTDKKNKYGILAGSLSYAFCLWGLYTAARHPYFANPMIVFPLMILGIEKIIKGERPYVFIASAAVAALSNFYFFYMIVILAISYALIRLVMLYRTNVKDGLLLLLRLGAMAVTGVCIAGIILLPIFMTFLNDSRLEASQPFHLFYPLSYYSRLPAVAISSETTYWLCIGLSAPVWIAVGRLFAKKRNAFLKVLFVICVMIIIFPIAGRFLNGMSYMTNRWSWAFALLCSYILVNEWDGIMNMSKKGWTWALTGCLIFYLIVLHFDKSSIAEALSALPMFFIALLVFEDADRKDFQFKQVMTVLIIGVSAINVAFWMYAPFAGNYVSEFEENDKIWSYKWPNNETDIIKELAGDKYTRYSGRAITTNVHFVNHISNTQFYFTNSIPSVSEFRDEMQIGEGLFQDYKGYDDRTSLLSLSSVEYYITNKDDKKGMPYGYSFVESMNALSLQQEEYLNRLSKETGKDFLSEEQAEKVTAATDNTYDVYRNKYALPFGYCYSSYIDEEQWDRLDPVQKQEIQLSAALVNGSTDGVAKNADQVPNYSIPYEIKCEGTDVVQKGNSFVTTANDTKVTFTLKEGVKEAETYFGIEGLDYIATPEYDLYFGSSDVDPLDMYNKTNWDLLSRTDRINIKKAKDYWNPVVDALIPVETAEGVRKTIDYRPPDSSFSSDRHNYIENMGYSKDGVLSITMTLPTRGIYTFDSISVYAIPMKDYAKKINSLKKNALRDYQLGNDTVKGKISVNGNKILCITTPYSGGWSVQVDGKAQDVLQINKRYIGVSIPDGTHTFKFRYRNPYKLPGLCITCIGILLTLGIAIITEKKERKRTSR